MVWNNFTWGAIRDIQLGMFGGRELGTSFTRKPNNESYNPDFAALARAHGVDAATVTDSRNFKEAAVRSNRSSLLDVHVDAEVRPPATGTWQLPPTPYGEPTFGDLYLPD